MARVGKDDASKGRKLQGVLALALALVVAPAHADADSIAQAQAQRLFEEGRALMAEGRYAEACTKFAASDRNAPSGGSLLNLADCYEKAGKTASAWARFKEVAVRADAAKRPDVADHARARAQALEPHLSMLSLQVPESSRVDGLVIKRDEEIVDRALWNSTLPIDPGAYVIEATAPHRKPWRGSATVPLAGPSVVRVVVGPLAPDVPDAPPASDMATQRKVAIGVGVAGVVAIGVGSFFGLRAMSKNDDAKQHCPASPACLDAEGPALTDSARSAATVSTVGFVAAGVLVAGAVVLWLTASPSASVPSPSQGRAGLLGGTF